MPQDIFFELARQMEWRRLARRVILRLAAARHYAVEGIDPGGNDNVFDAIAGANDLESQFLLREIRPAIQASVSKNPKMARDFRVAMTQLCLQEGNRFDGEYGGQPLLDWLTGANTRVSPVRQFSIYTSINRATARHCIESALHWIRQAGHAGTVILLDNRRVTEARIPRDGLRYYTRAMAVDHYELLREFRRRCRPSGRDLDAGGDRLGLRRRRSGRPIQGLRHLSSAEDQGDGRRARQEPDQPGRFTVRLS